GLFERGKNDLGKAVPDPDRRRRDHTAPGAAGADGASTDGGAAGSGALERSTRVPAIRSCRARLSPRSPAITKPSVNGAAEAKYARKRRSAAPNGGGASSPPTTRTPTIILPIVWPARLCSTVVSAPAKTTVKNDARDLNDATFSTS